MWLLTPFVSNKTKDFISYGVLMAFMPLVLSFFTHTIDGVPRTLSIGVLYIFTVAIMISFDIYAFHLENNLKSKDDKNFTHEDKEVNDRARENTYKYYDLPRIDRAKKIRFMLHIYKAIGFSICIVDAIKKCYDTMNNSGNELAVTVACFAVLIASDRVTNSVKEIHKFMNAESKPA